MRRLLLCSLLLSFCKLHAQQLKEKYNIDSASVEHTAVPKGELIQFTFTKSEIFPGTSRECWVYVPQQYQPSTPACVYINQDGIQWNAPIVFDNLIAAHEMPVTIGVFVTPGRIGSNIGDQGNERFNRSFEYDGLGDAYARFLLTELLPEVEKQKTANGRAIHLSKMGNDRAIGGSSSGAVCAFTAAWEKPAAFSRVFSAIGTYVGLRGAERYPGLIRKYEPKPIRIFLQDGSNDLNIYGGDWWKANEMMQRALEFSGYQSLHVWGEGGHNGNQGNAVFPEAMRWLWKDWPKPVATGKSANKFLDALLIPGENWEKVADGFKFTEGIAANENGEVFFQDIPNSKTYKIGIDGSIAALPVDAKRSTGTCFGPGKARYVVSAARKQLLAYDIHEKEHLIADSLAGNDLVVSKNGNIYVTVPEGADKPGKICLVTPGGTKTIVDEGIRYPNGIALTPDQTQLYVTECTSHWVWIFTINRDGSLSNKQRFGWLHVPDDNENAWADGLKCDTAGRVYVASRMGIQVLDQLGRVNAILPVPSGQSSNCCFGGAGFNYLYVTSEDKVYRRKLNVRGANPFEAPYKPAKPNL